MHQIFRSLLTFSTGGAFHAEDKQKKRLEKACRKN
jgi:hypothetical protein